MASTVVCVFGPVKDEQGKGSFAAVKVRLSTRPRHEPVSARRQAYAVVALVVLLIVCATTLLGVSVAFAASGWEGFGGGVLPGATWRPYASTSPFNLSAEGAAVHPDSAGIVQKVLSWSLPGNLVAGNAGTSSDWGHPMFFAEPTDPTYTLEATESWGSNPLDGMRIQIPAGAHPAGGEDSQMTVVTPEGWEYDFWHAQVPPAGGGTFKFGWGGRTQIDGNGLGSAGTAAGFGNLAGMIRAPELAAGKINHALFIVVKCAAKNTSFGYGTTASSTSSYVYPATHSGNTCPTEEANLPPLGAHFVLAMSEAQIQALAVPAWKKTILTALAHYGGYVGDTGGPGFAFMFESSTSYTALGQADPLAVFAKANGLPTWEGDYVFNMASGVEWEKYLRVVVPPSAESSSSPAPDKGWEGFGGGVLPGATWRPYASTSPFNSSAVGAAVHPDSAGIVQKVLSWSLPGNMVAGNAGTSSDWGHPTFFAEPTDPTYTLEATEPWGSNPLNGMRIQIPVAARPAGGEDHHMTVVTPEGWEYDFWHAQVPPAGGGTFKFGWGGRTRIDGNGLGSAGTAAGFGNLAGMIRAPELAAGKINHALFIVVKCAAKNTNFGYGTIASSTSSYVYPANKGGSTCASSEANAPPLGAHFVLAMSEAQIQALAVPAWKKTILTALAHYGGYVGDTGGSGFAFMFESSTSYTALGQADPLAAFAKANGLPTWEGDYVFNMASGVEWEKYLRVVVPPSQ